jgi:hypothetical protein
MKKKSILFALLILIILILIPLFINSYNNYSARQRNDITFCETDQDCVLQNFTNECGKSYGCFNKNERPLSELRIANFNLFDCYYSPKPTCKGYSICKCDNGRCNYHTICNTNIPPNNTQP